MEPDLMRAAAAAGVRLKMSYGGTLDIVDRMNEGESFDAILPPNGAYPSLALAAKPAASEKLFYSRVALGVKGAKLKQLGWDRKTPTWKDIAAAAGKSQLHFAMTSPVSSNTGMSALFAVASAAAGKTEDLRIEEIDAAVLKEFLSGQKLTAGSSGWLSEAFMKNPAPLDAMINYEAVILRANEKLAAADQLVLVYPQDGVITADYPLMLVNASRREDFVKLVAAFKTADFQQRVVVPAFLRPSVPDVSPAAGLSSAAVAELSFPNSLEVVDSILSAYQGDWRRPATSIFVLDTSGSMRGERILAMQEALKVLAGASASKASSRYARFQRREHAVLLAFSGRTQEPVVVDFNDESTDAARARVVQYADSLRADGETAIYAALMRAESMAAEALASDPDRYVSIVLLTDGRNTSGPDLEQFRDSLSTGALVRVFPILFGEASNEDMEAVAQLTGGRVFDGRKNRLSVVFKEIRGYQ
jgi:Ca-activated chloride channel family protein